MSELPRIGSKDWPWKQEDEDTHVLDIAGMTYEIRVEGGEARVIDDTDGQDQEVATFDLFRFGTYSDGDGTRLSPAQVRQGLATVKRFCEMDARRKARQCKKST